MRFRSSSSQAVSYTRGTRELVGLMSEKLRGGPSTFVKLSRTLRQTFAKIRLEVALNLPRKLQNSQKLVSAGWGLLLQRRILAATLRLRILRSTLVCGDSARTAVNTYGSPLQLLQATPTQKLLRKKKLSRPPSRNFRGGQR